MARHDTTGGNMSQHDWISVDGRGGSSLPRCLLAGAAMLPRLLGAEQSLRSGSHTRPADFARERSFEIEGLATGVRPEDIVRYVEHVSALRAPPHPCRCSGIRPLCSLCHHHSDQPTPPHPHRAAAVPTLAQQGTCALGISLDAFPHQRPSLLSLPFFFFAAARWDMHGSAPAGRRWAQSSAFSSIALPAEAPPRGSCSPPTRRLPHPARPPRRPRRKVRPQRMAEGRERPEGTGRTRRGCDGIGDKRVSLDEAEGTRRSNSQRSTHVRTTAAGACARVTRCVLSLRIALPKARPCGWRWELRREAFCFLQFTTGQKAARDLHAQHATASWERERSRAHGAAHVCTLGASAFWPSLGV